MTTGLAERSSPQSELSWLNASPLLWARQNVRLWNPATASYESLQPREYQTRLLADRSLQRLVLKARQTGISTLIAIEADHASLYIPNNLTLVVSRNQDSAQEVLDYCHRIFEGLEAPPCYAKRNESEIALQNGSRIVSLAATRDAGRGFAASRVYLDEFAFAAYAEEIYRSIRPTLAHGGHLTVISTPNGRQGKFYELWETGGSEWTRHRVHWRDCPAYGEAWYQRERPNYSARDWASEFECDFVASGMGGVFSEFCYYEQRPPVKAIVQFWDTAFSAKDRADFSACTTWAISNDGHIDFVSAYQEHLEFPELIQAMRAVAEREKAGYLLIEAKASGQSAIQVLRREVGIPVYAIDYKKGKDKEARANAAAPYVANGKVRFPRFHPQAEMLIRQMRDFPNSPKDDLVDSAVGAILWAVDSTALVQPIRARFG